MSRFLLLFVVVCAAMPALAYDPQFNTNTEPFSVYPVVGNLETQREYHGSLQDYPDTYEITADESFILALSIRIPDINDPRTDFSGIVVRKREQGGVEEVARLAAAAASWELVRDPVSGIRYLQGPTYEEPLAPGVYRVEVSTPDNRGFYELVIGANEPESGYFKKLGQVREVRAFYGLGSFGLLRSPLVHYPIGIMVLIGLLFVTWRWQRRKTSGIA